MQTTNYINLTFLKEISDGNENFFREFISLFLASAPKAISEMEKCCSSGEWDTLRQLAHKIKPSFNYIGLKELNQAAAKIEELASKKSDSVEIHSLIEKIRSVCAIAFVELEAEVKNGLS